jgi:hypothetical protein
VRAQICGLIALPRAKVLLVLSETEVDELQSQSRLWGERKNFLPLPRIAALFLGHLVCSLVTLLSCHVCAEWRAWVRFLTRSQNIFISHNPSSFTMALGFTQPPIEMSTRKSASGGGIKHSWSVNWQPRRHLWADYLKNVGASTLWCDISSAFMLMQLRSMTLLTW